MDRSLSLITPTGHLTLGNLLGALRGMAAAQETGDCFYGVYDLHAMTTPHDPPSSARRSPRSRPCSSRPGWTRRAPLSSGRARCRRTASWPTCWSARRTPAS